jgi:hypothetical protein
MDDDRHKQIAKRAYDIWEAEGRPQGCQLAHWLRAEAELNAQLPVRAEMRSQPVPTRTRKLKKARLRAKA